MIAFIFQDKRANIFLKIIFWNSSKHFILEDGGLRKENRINPLNASVTPI